MQFVPDHQVGLYPLSLTATNAVRRVPMSVSILTVAMGVRVGGRCRHGNSCEGRCGRCLWGRAIALSASIVSLPGSSEVKVHIVALLAI